MSIASDGISLEKLAKKSTQSKTRASIRREAINPRDFNTYKLPWTCEDCSHFSATTEKCLLGYKTEPHRRSTFEKTYELSGTVALCRFLEID